MSDDAAQPRDTKTRILDAAETRMRRCGYHAVSTRDVAGDIGIKPASLHHHYPTKSDLGAAVARRYGARFIAALGDPARFEGDWAAARAAYIAAFEQALDVDGAPCLCALFGAEAAGLPDPVAEAAGAFFADNLTWLEQAAPSLAAAAKTLAALEGALIVALSMRRAGVGAGFWAQVRAGLED